MGMRMIATLGEEEESGRAAPVGVALVYDPQTVHVAKMHESCTIVPQGAIAVQATVKRHRVVFTCMRMY